MALHGSVPGTGRSRHVAGVRARRTGSEPQPASATEAPWTA